jgi:4-amino-4-deoxy-L-arabinose transferase-like glycosyltransferase
VKSKAASIVIFFAIFLAILIAIHLPYLRLPFFWDELGQFVPASLDIYQLGAWIPKTTLPNVHPPAVMAYLALVWRVVGFSIPATRIAMLLLAAAGLLFSFLLAIRLSRKTAGAPAFAAAIFLLATPIFYTQSMMAQLDMPAMTFTALALLLFLDGHIIACVAACTVLVLVKETALSTPFVFALWLWFRDRRIRQALYFLAPAIALGLWLVALRHATGHWLGNDEFARYNLSDSLEPGHIAGTLARRIYFLFMADGLWIGAITLFVGVRVLRGRDWTVALLVAGAQIVLVSIFGGAQLDRYSVPALPILYAAIAAAGSVYPASWRWTTQAAMTFALLLGLFWNPPYPFSLENNLAMADMIGLQQQAASYLEDRMPGKRIASAWPFTDALSRPELGYVRHPLPVERAPDLRFESLSRLNRGKFDVLVLFCRTWALECGGLDSDFARNYVQRTWGDQKQATSEQIRQSLGFVPIVRWTERGQWIEIYVPER